MTVWAVIALLFLVGALYGLTIGYACWMLERAYWRGRDGEYDIDRRKADL